MTFTCEQFLNVDGLTCVEINAVLYGRAALITLTIVVVVVALFGLFWLTGKVLVVLVVVELVLVVEILPSN